MTNFEKYKDDVLSIVDKEDFVAVVNDKPIKCSSTVCTSCKNSDYDGRCTAAFIIWLYQEYEEKPKLSERAYHFLKSLPEGARIKYSSGFLYINIEDTRSIYCADNFFLPKLPQLLEAIWYEVSELLEWEVE